MMARKNAPLTRPLPRPEDGAWLPRPEDGAWLRRLLIFSDVHLTPHVRHGGPWLGYRRPEHSPDALLAHAVDTMVGTSLADGAHLELVLAGDVFDLDAPPADAPADVRTYAACRSDAGAARVMQALLDDHPRFVGALQRLLATGGTVIVLPGNHDAQLALPLVRGVLRAALVPPGAWPAPPRLAFRSWFHRPFGTRVLVEHGHQYDPLCVMSRLYGSREGAAGTLRLEDTVGSVGTHYGQAFFGLQNPHAADPFDLSPEAQKTLKECGRRALTDANALACAVGAIRDLMLVPRRAEVDDRAAHAAATARPERALGDGAWWLRSVGMETQSSPRELAVHQTLAAPKGDVSLLARAAAKDARYGIDCEARQRDAMRALARLYGANVVVMGHTHEPFVRRDGGVTFANSGSWTPADPADPIRGTFTEIVLDGSRELYTGLRRVRVDGRIE